MKIPAALVIDANGDAAIAGAIKDFSDHQAVDHASDILAGPVVQVRIVEIEIDDALLKPLQATAKEVE